MIVGLISDTHGLLRPEALDALRGVDHIIHAGDIGSRHILQELQVVAPVTAIRGNNDSAAWAREVPDVLTVVLDGVSIHVIHDVKDLGSDLPPADVIVSGHSHKPSVESRDGRLYVNPGSAGPRRFTLPITLALLDTGQGRPQATIRHLC